MSTNQEVRSPKHERRAGCRYPVVLDLSYQGAEEKREFKGTGKTVDISSSGILFVGEHTLTEGAGVELTLRWPFLLDNSIPLQLKVSAKVKRIDGTRAAVEIVSHEFRIAARTGFLRSTSAGGNKNAGNRARAPRIA